MNAARPTRRPARWSLLLLLTFLTSLLCLAAVLFSPLFFPDNQNRLLPISLHSVLQADYRAAPFAFSIPGFGTALIESALQDQPRATAAPQQLATLVSGLQTPVPTVTPMALVYASSPTPVRYVPPQPTSTPFYRPPGPTQAATATLWPTLLPSATPTLLLTPTSISTLVPPTPTSSIVVPTATPGSGYPPPPTAAPQPTSTPRPPNTPQPTSAPVPTKVPTIPPTAAPTSVPPTTAPPPPSGYPPPLMGMPTPNTPIPISPTLMSTTVPPGSR